MALVLVYPVVALDGDPAMHDPSTVIVHDGKILNGGGASVQSCSNMCA